MTREGLEKYHTNAAWRAAYEAHLARAEQVSPLNADALTDAEVAADSALAEAETAEARQADAIAGTRARLAAREAEERAQAEAEAQPDAAQEAMARVVAGINARR